MWSVIRSTVALSSLVSSVLRYDHSTTWKNTPSVLVNDSRPTVVGTILHSWVVPFTSSLTSNQSHPLQKSDTSSFRRVSPTLRLVLNFVHSSASSHRRVHRPCRPFRHDGLVALTPSPSPPSTSLRPHWCPRSRLSRGREDFDYQDLLKHPLFPHYIY